MILHLIWMQWTTTTTTKNRTQTAITHHSCAHQRHLGTPGCRCSAQWPGGRCGWSRGSRCNGFPLEQQDNSIKQWQAEGRRGTERRDARGRTSQASQPVNSPQFLGSSSESSWQSSSPSHTQRFGMQWPVWHWKLLASHVCWPTEEETGMWRLMRFGSIVQVFRFFFFTLNFKSRNIKWWFTGWWWKVMYCVSYVYYIAHYCIIIYTSTICLLMVSLILLLLLLYYYHYYTLYYNGVIIFCIPLLATIHIILYHIILKTLPQLLYYPFNFVFL